MSPPGYRSRSPRRATSPPAPGMPRASPARCRPRRWRSCREQGQGLDRPAVVLERPELRIDVQQVGRRRREVARGDPDQVVAERGDEGTRAHAQVLAAAGCRRVAGEDRVVEGRRSARRRQAPARAGGRRGAARGGGHGGRVARDRAPLHLQDARVDDPAAGEGPGDAVVGQAIAGDRAVDQDQRPVVGDPAAGVVGAVSRDGDALERERAEVVDGAAAIGEASGEGQGLDRDVGAGGDEQVAGGAVVGPGAVAADDQAGGGRAVEGQVGGDLQVLASWIVEPASDGEKTIGEPSVSSAMACRSDPGPASAVVVTTKD